MSDTNNTHLSLYNPFSSQAICFVVFHNSMGRVHGIRVVFDDKCELQKGNTSTLPMKYTFYRRMHILKCQGENHFAMLYSINRYKGLHLMLLKKQYQ